MHRISGKGHNAHKEIDGKSNKNMFEKSNICEQKKCIDIERNFKDILSKTKVEQDEKIKRVTSELKSQRSTIEQDIARFKSTSEKMINDSFTEFYEIYTQYKTEIEQLHREASTKDEDARREIENNLLNRFNELNSYQEELTMKQISIKDELSDKILEIVNQQNEIRNQQIELKDEQVKFKEAINNFYSNIVAIIGLLVATFSIIGINMNVIPTLINTTRKMIIQDVIIVNVSLICAIYFMFYIYFRFVRVDNSKFTVKDIVAILILVLFAFLFLSTL